MPTPDDHHQRPRPSPLGAFFPARQSADDRSSPPSLDRQHHPVHAMAATRPSASIPDRSMSPTSPSMPTDSSVTSSNPTKTQSKRGFKSFLTLKEPSTSAFEQYAAQMKAETGITRGPSGPSGSGISSRKLPANVPKVNSRWDGLPKTASERHSGSSSNKRSSEGSQKRSDIGWTPPASSGARSSRSRKKAGSDDTIRRKSSSKRSARVDDRQRPEPQPLSINVQTRPDSSIQIVPAMSTHTRDDDEEEIDDPEAIPEMSLFWPPNYESPDPIQSAGGASEPGPMPSRVSTAPARSMPLSLPSDNSSPNMPQTPEDEEPLPVHPKQKASRQPFITHSRDSSADSGPGWSFPPTEPDYSARTSMSDTAPPPIPTKSNRRRSLDSFSSHTHTASDATDKQLDGSVHTIPTNNSPLRTKSFSRPRYQKANDEIVTRIWSSSEGEGEGDEIDSVDVPRYKPKSVGSATPSKARSNFSRLITPGRPPRDSAGGPPTTSTTPHSPLRSFSRPMLPGKSTSSNQSAPSTMGAPSIVRSGQPAHSAVTSSSSDPDSGAPVFGRLGMVPPRFQPGRVIVKDSDLDTIAEADSVYSASIHQDSRRNSYASTIDADIPRRRSDGYRSGLRDQYDGTADDESETDDDSSLRTSTYGFSEDDADSIDDAAPVVPGRFHGISRSSYYANASNPDNDGMSLSNSDVYSDDRVDDGATDDGEETERENGSHPDLDDDAESYHAHLSDISSTSSHAHAVRRARERAQSYDQSKVVALTGEDPTNRPGTPDTFDLSYGMPDLPTHDLAETLDDTAVTHAPTNPTTTETSDTHDFELPPRVLVDPQPQYHTLAPIHALTPQASFTSQTSQTPSQLDPDSISLADSSYTLDSINTATSNLTASWYKSPRERLGLGGFIRRSGVEVPWQRSLEEIPQSPPSAKDAFFAKEKSPPTSPGTARRESKDDWAPLNQNTGAAVEVGKDSSAMIRYMLQSHDGASDRPGGSSVVPLKAKSGAGGKEEKELRRAVGRKSLLGFRLF